MSVVYWSIVALVLPVSIVVDRWSRKKTVALMALFWSLATAACAFTKTFPQLLMARAGIGIGEAGYAPAGTAMLSGLFPPEKRSRMMGVWNISIPLGIAVGMGLGGFIATHWGWRHAFGLVAIPGAIVAILFFFIKDYKTVELVKTDTTCTTGAGKIQMSKMDIVWEFLRTPSLIFTNIGFIGCIFVNNAIIMWLPPYFHRTAGISISEAGMKTSLLMILALVGLPLGGWLADMWFKKRQRARLLFPAITSALNAIVIFVAISLLTGQAQYFTLLGNGYSGFRIRTRGYHRHAGGHPSGPEGHFLFRLRRGSESPGSVACAHCHRQIVRSVWHSDGDVHPARLPGDFSPDVSGRIFLLRERFEQGGEGYPGMRRLKKR